MAGAHLVLTQKGPAGVRLLQIQGRDQGCRVLLLGSANHVVSLSEAETIRNAAIN